MKLLKTILILSTLALIVPALPACGDGLNGPDTVEEATQEAVEAFCDKAVECNFPDKAACMAHNMEAVCSMVDCSADFDEQALLDECLEKLPEIGCFDPVPNACFEALGL